MCFNLGDAIVTDGAWLPWLVEGFEIENVYAPCQKATDSLVIELLRILGASLCSFVVGTSISRPTWENLLASLRHSSFRFQL